MSLHHSRPSAPAVPPVLTSSGGTNPQSPTRIPGQQQMANLNATLGNNMKQYPPQSLTPTAPEKPVFKMRRTGFSGPIPLAGPSVPPLPGNGATKIINPSPLTASLTATRTSLETTSGSRSGANPVSLREAHPRPSSQLQNFATTDGLDRHHPIELESDHEMVDSSTSAAHTPAPVQTFTPSATQPKENVFDDKAYKSWTGNYVQHPKSRCSRV